MEDMRILITAGATRNQVDAIRYLSAHATGQTGVALITHISDRLAQQGVARSLFLLGSAEACLRLQLAVKGFPWDICEHEEFFGTRDLMERMKLNVPSADVVIHSAAVGDYEMAGSTEGKIPSGQPEVNLRLTPTPKILDHIRKWNPTCYLVSFKAAPPGTSDEDLVRIARAQLERTGSNVVFANVIGQTERVILVSADEIQTGPREVLIEILVQKVLAHEDKSNWPVRTSNM